MAYIWFMSMNCDESEENARALAAKFDLGEFRVPNAGRTTLDVGVDKNDSGWECHVTPVDSEGALNAHGGPADEKEATDLDAAAAVLYQRLRRLSGYGFAWFGCEVGDWRDTKTLIEELLPDGFLRKMIASSDSLAGLVVSDALWTIAGKPPGFAPFAPSYVWVPWTTAWKELKVDDD